MICNLMKPLTNTEPENAVCVVTGCDRNQSSHQGFQRSNHMYLKSVGISPGGKVVGFFSCPVTSN
jgi:hypothetical protein